MIVLLLATVVAQVEMDAAELRDRWQVAAQLKTAVVHSTTEAAARDKCAKTRHSLCRLRIAALEGPSK